jgi:lysyl-tRNA synthetase class 2
VGEAYEAFKAWDVGDVLGAEGTVMRTRTGELSLRCDSSGSWQGAAPAPDKWHGFADVETRYRQRYVDLIINDDARRVFELRAR